MRIVIVEDEVKVRNGMANLISSHTNHSVVGQAKNGQEGLELIMKYYPDLIITDIQMPVMDGLTMLEQLKQEGIHCHCVILTGYAEFEYAKRAITYGADDYLLKPIAVEDVERVLAVIEEKLEQEAKQIEGTPEGYIRDLILGTMVPSEEHFNKLKRICHMDDNKDYCFLCGYLGGVLQKHMNILIQNLQKMKETYTKYHMHFVVIESKEELFCLLQCPKEENAFEELTIRLQRRLYSEECKGIWCFHKMQTIEELVSNAKRMRAGYSYGMVLGNGSLITLKMIEEFIPNEYHYPKEIEYVFQSSICNRDQGKLQQTVDSFKQEMEECRCEPEHIRQIFIRMASFVVNVLLEFYPDMSQQIHKFNTIKKMGKAVTRMELELSFNELLDLLSPIQEKKEDIRNYTIKRAINYIRLHYREGFSLDDVAAELQITPEYLSTLFNKEVGINFSVFIKEFRISHAKRMLKGTNRKIYEIAQEVGL